MMLFRIFKTLLMKEPGGCIFDLNKDGAINMSDVIIIASKFNTVV